MKVLVLSVKLFIYQCTIFRYTEYFKDSSTYAHKPGTDNEGDRHDPRPTLGGQCGHGEIEEDEEGVAAADEDGNACGEVAHGWVVTENNTYSMSRMRG